jgi:hypothetical protein
VSLRDTINAHPTIAGAALVLALGALGVTIYSQLTGGRIEPPNTRYYYDLDTGKVFSGKYKIAPIEAPSASSSDGTYNGVTARIFACGSCRDDYSGMTASDIEEAGAKIGFLQHKGPMDKQADHENLAMATAKVSKVEPIEWHSITSQKGMTIATANLDCSGGYEEIACYP